MSKSGSQLFFLFPCSAGGEFRSLGGRRFCKSRYLKVVKQKPADYMQEPWGGAGAFRDRGVDPGERLQVLEAVA